MDKNQSKDGVSVKEIEEFAKKHRFQVFFGLSFILAGFFTFVMWGTGWSIVCAVIGALLGVVIPGKVAYIAKAVLHFVLKQQPTTQLVLGIVGLILAIFIPPLFFLILGLHGTKDMQHWALEIDAQHKNSPR